MIGKFDAEKRSGEVDCDGVILNEALEMLLTAVESETSPRCSNIGMS